MKKLLGLFLLILCYSQHTAAQTKIKHSLGVQVGVGINYALHTSQPQTGLLAGINYRLNINKFIIESDLVYINKNPVTMSLIGATHYGHSFHYVALPIKFGHTFGKEDVLFTPKIGILNKYIFAQNYRNDDESTIDVNPLVELELGFRLNKKMQLFFTTIFEYDIPEKRYSLHYLFHSNIYNYLGVRFQL